MASKYTKQQVLDEKRCGIKYFERAVEKIGRTQLLANAVAISHRHPDTWGPGWSNFSWALGNAVIDAIDSRSEISQTWNVDEVLTNEEMTSIARELGFKLESYEPLWKRRKPKI